MRRRWVVVRHLGEGRVMIVSRHWTKAGAQRFIDGVEMAHNEANRRMRKNTMPGSPPLSSPYPYPTPLSVEHLKERIT